MTRSLTRDSRRAASWANVWRGTTEAACSSFSRFTSITESGLIRPRIFFTSAIIRTIAWIPFLGRSGAFNQTVIGLGLATRPLIARAHAAGLAVHVWTVNDAETMNSLLDLGADGIMTDQIELLRKVMIDRGQWNPRAGAGDCEA